MSSAKVKLTVVVGRLAIIFGKRLQEKLWPVGQDGRRKAGSAVGSCSKFY
jgi:hypothetical protein